MHRNSSFPVGKVQFLQLRPMCFTEFLDAMREEGLAKMILSQDWVNISMFSSKLKELLKQYYFVGGMPEAVLAFSDTHDWQEVREIQKDILKTYELDFSKHAPAKTVPRIRMLWNSIPRQLSKENRKFIYGLVKEGARAREYEMGLQWLIDGGLIYKVTNITAPRLPIKSYEDNGAFKIFILDIGLLGTMSGLDSTTVIDGYRTFTEFKGALTEQYVHQELILKYDVYYYSKANSQMEIDFVIQKGNSIMPVEVKAEENLKSKSLRQFVAYNSIETAYRVSMSNYREEVWMTKTSFICH